MPELSIEEQRQALLHYSHHLRCDEKVFDALDHCSDVAVERVCAVWRRETEAGERLERGFLTALENIFGFGQADILDDERAHALALLPV
jgi:hypothetical protein